MANNRKPIAAFCIALALYSSSVHSQQSGGIRGMVYDREFEAPLSGAQIHILENDEKTATTDEGNFVFPQLNPGTYTLVISREGYARQVRGDTHVHEGRMTEVDVWLSGDFTEMDEFIVQDLQLGAGTEIALLELRMESPALMDSISADLMSRAGAGDAASALKLVTGASVQDGKYAVIRGLPDRYVNSQINGVRLPTADAEKRAVALDQFPSSAIDSIQVSKSFTPDQQGDASGGAVNIVLRSIPEETLFSLSASSSYNTRGAGGNEFLTSRGGGVNFWGRDRRRVQEENIGANWDGAVGVQRDDPPTDYKWSASSGGTHEFENGFRIGGLGTFFYERDSSFYKNGVDDKYWVVLPGQPMTPRYTQGSPDQGEFKTQLFDVTRGSEEVKWGGLGSVGIQFEEHLLSLAYLYTHISEDVATLAEDTRGKLYYFPDYDVNDPTHPGNLQRDAAPYIRTETLQYTERNTHTLLLRGRHGLPDPGWNIEHFLNTLRPELDWGVSQSFAGMVQPDKRQFGSMWWAESYNPGFPPYIPPSTLPPVHRPFKPSANFTLGNLQRSWKEITEDSDQGYLNLKLPFEQWSDNEGYLKFGVFHDEVKRDYRQDSFSNFRDNTAQFEGPFEEFWSDVFPFENHPVTPANIDVDYRGNQVISAWYYMADVPLCSFFNLIGGARHERTRIGIVNYPESDVYWFPPGSRASVILNPGDADVSYGQSDVLPSIGFKFVPFEPVTLRGSYSQTVARQTFRELTPIQQQEFLGGDVFIGNPYLRMSSLRNWDLRLDYVPRKGSLISISWFYKSVTDPIEYIQRVATFIFTTPVNYPEGELSGYELEFRQDLDVFWNGLEGLSIGANATFIESEVTLPDDEAALFEQPNIQAPMRKRDMTQAPEHLYNLFLTYDLDRLGLRGTQVAPSYSIKGDTLIAGAGTSQGKFVPSVYELEYGSLNLGVTQKIGEHFRLRFMAKNLLDPDIRTAYRSEYIERDITKTSYRKGMDFSLGITILF